MDDVGTPQANAVLKAGGGTGVLVAPDLVLTSGHTITGDRRGTPHEDALPGCDDWQVPGWWYPLVYTTSNIDILVGHDSTNWQDRLIATHYSMPGCADMMLLRLERPIDPSIAVPMRLLIAAGNAGPTYLRDQNLTMVGWGVLGGEETAPRPRIRQKAAARYDRHDEEKFYVLGEGGATIRGGDSGSPLIWTHPSGTSLVVGVAQGTEAGGGRYTATFRTPVNGKPSVSDWLRQVAPSAVYGPETLERAPVGTVPLLSWWSSSRVDNFLTSAPGWAGGVGTVRSPDYRFVQVEGYAFHPELPPPEGTVPLHAWFDPGRGDNFVTTHPSWQHWDGDGNHRSPDYGFSRVEGYVFDPRLPQPPDTVPLFGWYSPSRNDNWTTTGHAEEGRAGRDLGPDYRFVRLEGYLPVPT